MFVVPGTNTLYTKQEILARGILTGEIIFCSVCKYNLEGHIVLDYLLFKYMIGNHHSLQLIRICFEINYIDHYERIIEDAPVCFHTSGMWICLIVKTNVPFSDSMLKFAVCG